MADTKQYKPHPPLIGHVAEQLVIAQILLSAPEALCCYHHNMNKSGVTVCSLRNGIGEFLLLQ